MGRAGARPAPTETISLGGIIGAYKSLCFRQWYQYLKQNNRNDGAKFWQRNYYESVIRDEKSLLRIQEYIGNNYKNWEKDTEFTKN